MALSADDKVSEELLVNTSRESGRLTLRVSDAITEELLENTPRESVQPTGHSSEMLIDERETGANGCGVIDSQPSAQSNADERPPSEKLAECCFFLAQKRVLPPEQIVDAVQESLAWLGKNREADDIEIAGKLAHLKALVLSFET